jgi:hypothetical protein
MMDIGMGRWRYTFFRLSKVMYHENSGGVLLLSTQPSLDQTSNISVIGMDGSFRYLDTMDAITRFGVSRFGFPVMDEGSGTACPAL